MINIEADIPCRGELQNIKYKGYNSCGYCGIIGSIYIYIF